MHILFSVFNVAVNAIASSFVVLIGAYVNDNNVTKRVAGLGALGGLIKTSIINGSFLTERVTMTGSRFQPLSVWLPRFRLLFNDCGVIADNIRT